MNFSFSNSCKIREFLYNAKWGILQSAGDNQIESGDLVDLSSGGESKPIQVENCVTPWYQKTNQIALEARKAGQIRNFSINEGGMVVHRTANAPPTFVWSTEQLITFIDNA